MKYNPTDIARQFLFVREAGANKGVRVEAIQHWSNGSPGQSWCAYFVTMVLDICFQGNSPLARQGSTDIILQQAKKNGWLVTDPKKDDIFLYVHPGTEDAHHVGFITEDGGGVGIAGNTSEDGTSSNGDRVAEHSISKNQVIVKYVRYPR